MRRHAPRFRRCLPAVAVLLLVGCLMSPGSAAAAGGRAPIEIVAPRPGALLTGRVVTVRVRTRRPDARLQVTMYGKGSDPQRVGRLFRRVGPGDFVARLPVGARLGWGSNSIFVGERGSRAGAETTFTVARPGRRLLSVRRVESGPVEVPPLNLRIAVPKPGETVWARLNGHPARSSFEPTGPRHWRAALGPKDGLRYGRNRLSVTAFTRSGRYQRQRLSFVVRRDGPIADAGRDRHGRVAHPLRLDGTASVAPPRERPAFRWRIVRKPKGSHPHLRRAHSLHPVLRTDVNGTYRLRLRASPRSDRGRRARASAFGIDLDATPTGETGTGPESGTESEKPVAETTGATGAAGEGIATSDETTVQVGPNVAPTGLPVRTMATAEGTIGIEVGAHFYPMEAGTVVQLLALDRETLEPKLAKSYRGAETGALLEAVKGLEDGDLVILSGGGRSEYGLTPQTLPAALEQVREAIDSIGGMTTGDQAAGVLGELQSGGAGGWSVIGIPGLPEGQAYQMIGLQQGEAEPVGGLRGNFQLDSTGVNFAFTWAPESHPFDTEAAATATENTMELDGQPWHSWNLPFPGSTEKTGFQLLWFDADTLKPRLSASFEANLWVPEEEAEKGLWPLRNDLRQILADPKPGLLMLHTIGRVETPAYTNSTTVDGKKVDGNDIRGNVLGRLASLLQEFGANPYVFDTFGTSAFGGKGTPGGYTLVGVTGLRRLKGPNAGAERSTQLLAGATARLTGALTRDRQGVLAPSSTNSPGPQPEVGLVQPQLTQLLGEPGPAFPDWSELSPEAQALQAAIAKELKMPYDQHFEGIQAEYWENSGNQSWEYLAGRLENMCRPTATEPNPCTPAKADLAHELEGQFLAVKVVRSYFEDELEGIFSDVFLRESFGISSVTNEVLRLFNPPEESTSGPDALGILGGVLGIAGGIGEFVPIAGEAIGPAAEVAEGLTEVIAASTTETDGSSRFDPYGFHTTTAKLGEDLENAFKDTKYSLEHTADLLVSHPESLLKAAALIRDNSDEGGWGLDTASRDRLEEQLHQTVRQFVWLTIMQPVVATYECAEEDIGGIKKHNEEAVMNTLVNYPEWIGRQSPRTYNLYDTYIALAKRNEKHNGWPSLLDSNLTKRLFGSPAAETGGIGFLPPYLMADSLAEESEPQNEVEEEFYGPVFPTSAGLLHQTRGFGLEREEAAGLARRAEWSDYTPSCGKGQSAKWSNPEYYAWAEP